MSLRSSKTILVTGGAGFIGAKLTQAFMRKGYNVIVADHKPPEIKNSGLEFLQIDLASESLPDSYDGKLYAVIHLAGKNIFGRWTEKFKKEVYNSRIISTRRLVETISAWQNKPAVFISASAFGYYGHKGEEEVGEDVEPGNDFLAKICVDWEQESRRVEVVGIRSVQVRTALVLGQAGFLQPLFLPFRLGAGAWIGNGKGWFPWVHIDDIINIYVFALENGAVRGPLNTAAPAVVRQKEFMKVFGQTMNTKILFPLPLPILKIRYGELAETFSNSVKMSSQKLMSLGFQFKYPKLDDALNNIAAIHKKTLVA